MKIWKITDQGVVRKENQDSCAVVEHEKPAYKLAVVCDGMGGAKSGNVASSMAVDSFTKEIEKSIHDDITQADLSAAAIAAVDVANEAIYEKASGDPDCTGMGTTLVAAISVGDILLILNVGDSRAYAIDGDGIHAISRDHSWVQDMVDHGSLTEEEARKHPNRNLITRALGTEKTVECDTFLIPKEEQTGYLLLCSDGLVNTVTDQEILYEVIHGDTQDDCLERLLKISIQRGAPDNVTAILMQYEKEAE